ncbi:hypothetical protein Zmor_008924 [Zophobas morio]|uniref:Uncharacterized protein n=1 Tax=Zophobas morio TaxID=2755281 RepID=A0AA38HM00_9CUCU|nr:hypothetical protein Zmor_008924 [Zophobas morio]
MLVSSVRSSISINNKPEIVCAIHFTPKFCAKQTKIRTSYAGGLNNHSIAVPPLRHSQSEGGISSYAGTSNQSVGRPKVTRLPNERLLLSLLRGCHSISQEHSKSSLEIIVHQSTCL